MDDLEVEVGRGLKSRPDLADSSPPRSADEVRSAFTKFFVERGHTAVPSSSLVPSNDPTLLFVNAGMVQFKDVFLGRDPRSYVRAVTVQRCLRAGGKHNDLDNVGFTPRHQTMFEMLGNFSFGDYFKPDAIRWAWEFLTEVLAIPAERLAVSVYSGEGEPAPADEEAYELWQEFVPKSRIYRCPAKDNFWAMGDTGPCGPCSEIHIYNGERAPDDALKQGDLGPAHEDSRYLELWNLVFMQYERLADGTLQPLPKPSVDTGAGLERLVATVNRVASNYDTDLLAPLVSTAMSLAGVDPNAKVDPAPYRVIADHARATAFLIADGVFPDRGGRSYVLRRIMRRAIRYGTEVGLDEPFFHVVCAKVVERFGASYPELRDRAATIDEVVRAEEMGFRRTLVRGLRRLDAALSELTAADGGSQRVFSPDVAADLYDTYGFPFDLTAVICRERGISLDEDAAEQALRRRQRSGESEARLGQDTAVADVYFQLRNTLGDTVFTGYEEVETTAKVIGLVVAGETCDRAQEGQAVELVVDRTPFYAESGGQVGDTGMVVHGEMLVKISDTVKPTGDLHVHRGRVQQGSIAVGMEVKLAVDAARRDAIRRNHSATHLLHHALREVLGEHVVQRGSLVEPDRLRFDFSHGKPLTRDQREAVENRVNRDVVDNAPTQTRIMTLAEAKNAGAIGLFDEKYGDAVRVVAIGGESVELCGGTHVTQAGDIGLMKIVGESSIAQGVRRIEALTGMAAVRHVQEMSATAETLVGQVSAAGFGDVPDKVAKLQDDLRGRERTIADLQRKLATGAGGQAADEVRDVEGVKLLAKRVAVADSKTLRAAADTLRDRLGSGVVVLGAETRGKATLLVAVTKDLVAKIHAGRLVGQLASHVGGRGGGRPDLAQAGGPDAQRLDQAIDAAQTALAEQLRAS